MSMQPNVQLCTSVISLDSRLVLLCCCCHCIVALADAMAMLVAPHAKQIETNIMDGVVAVTQRPVKPGGEQG